MMRYVRVERKHPTAMVQAYEEELTPVFGPISGLADTLYGLPNAHIESISERVSTLKCPQNGRFPDITHVAAPQRRFGS